MLYKKLSSSPGVKKILLITYDVFVIQAASIVALWLRFEFDFSSVPSAYLQSFAYYTFLNTSLTIALFFVFKLYSSLWMFAGSAELINIFVASVLSCLELILGDMIFSLSMPKSFYVLYAVFLFAGAAAIRVYYRLRRFFKRHTPYKNAEDKRILLVGAGEAGSMILKEITDSHRISGRVVCCVDDSPEKKGKYMCGVKIEGGRECIPDLAKKYRVDEIILAIPSLGARSTSEILDICKNIGCKVRILPGIYQFINDEAQVSTLRDVELEDLLGREAIRVNLDEIEDYIIGRTVMVTGGGGSIGSELCRQIANYQPKRLVLVDNYENNAFDIQQELIKDHPELALEVLIASVRDVKRMFDIFRTYRPDVVYHAAAHKHVPLMEDSPEEAVKNNVFGTLHVAQAAGECGVKRFVLISTDKAVNPTNIMGASKRMCEMIIQTMNSTFQTDYVAVRFGNVLGSNGSVVPLFKKQIASGGPVTVTHRDVKRYFMTIPEAVSLVLQAGAFARGGEIFVLDMGEPVLIDDLARNLIRLSGFEPDVDIDVVYTGLRPGEKLFEEIKLTEEGMEMTENHLIHVASPVDFNKRDFLEKLEEINRLIEEDKPRSARDIRREVSQVVSTYKMPEGDLAELVDIRFTPESDEEERAGNVQGTRRTRQLAR